MSGGEPKGRTAPLPQIRKRHLLGNNEARPSRIVAVRCIFSQSRAKNHGFIEKTPHIGVHSFGGYARPFPIYIMYPSMDLKKRDSEQKNLENILLEINNLTSHY